MARVPCKDPECKETFADTKSGQQSASQHYRYQHGVGYRMEPRPTPASYAPNLERVPSQLEKLPWISIPRDPNEIAMLAATIVIPEKLPESHRTFWLSLKAHLEVLSRRSATE